MPRLFTTCTFFFLSLFFCQLSAQPDLNFDSWKTGFTRPVDIANAGDGTNRLFIVEQAGIIKIIENNIVLTTPFLDITARVDDTGNEMGLLGLVFHPNYSTNGFFYVNYTDNQGDSRVSRFQVDPTDANLGDPTSEIILLEIEQPFSNHNAGDLSFGPTDGYLYIASGDGGSGGDPGDRAQDGGCLLGKMLRIDVDGGGNAASPSQSGGNCDFTSSANYTVPNGNPFVGDPTVLDEVWSMGLRNPWRFSFDRTDNHMWIADVGQGDWEEVDFEKTGFGGQNYGWRCYEGNHAHNTAGCSPQSSYTGPVFEYDHTAGRSITGGYVYRGTTFPNMAGYYILADYITDNVWALFRDINGNVTSTMYTTLSADDITSFGEDEAGELYAAGFNNGNGTIYKVEDNSPLPAELTSFSGIHDNGINKLFWTTASELNVAFFDIEKSKDGQRFTSMGKVEAIGSSGLHSYEYLDKEPSYEINYYRLRIVDNDGSFEYSKVIQIRMDKPFELSIFPNPNDGKFSISYQGGVKLNATLKIYNTSGKLILAENFENVEAFEKDFDLNNLSKGIYLVQFNAGSIVRTQKILIR